jgi:formiminotetrahydrofolate cyclodeaminase
MKLIDLSVKQFVDTVDSKSPAPGGGSVSSLMSSMGVALARMVGHLTVDKKKFIALDPTIQFEFKDVIQSLETIKFGLMQSIDLDTEAFNLIMDAYKMPKETDEEKRIRNLKIQEGTLEAIMVPLKVATLSLSALHQFDYIITYGNKQTISDLGVSVLALSSGAFGALMNVMINLPGLEDEIARHQYQIQVDNLMEQVTSSRDQLLEKVYLSLKVK